MSVLIRFDGPCADADCARISVADALTSTAKQSERVCFLN